MKIDFDDNGHPRALLVSVSIPDQADSGGKFNCVFIPIEQLIALRHVDRLLVGHPWLDVPADQIINYKLPRSDVRRLRRYVANGKYIAMSAAGDRGKLSRGVRLDRGGEVIVSYMFSWRDPVKYISPEDIAWLRIIEEESHRYAEMFWAAVAMGELFKSLHAKIKKPKKLLAKKKRRQSLINKEHYV